MAMTNFRASDMPARRSGGEPGEQRTLTTAEVEHDETEGAPSVDQQREDQPLSVPSGSTADVLKWVDGDKAKAQLALDTEQGADKPRKGLTEQLEEIVAQ